MGNGPAHFQFRDTSSEIGTNQAEVETGLKKAFAGRLVAAMTRAGLSATEVSERSGIPKSSLSRYMKGDSTPKSEHLFPLSDAVEVDPRWLISGARQRRFGWALTEAGAADWIDIDEYDLRELTDDSPGSVISTTPFRKDWLNRTLGQSTGLWLARLPADLPARDLREGDLVFLRDVQPGEAQDGATYIVRVSGFLTVVRVDSLQDAGMPSIESNLADRRLGFRNIGYEDGKAVLVARVLGVPLKRL